MNEEQITDLIAQQLTTILDEKMMPFVIKQIPPDDGGSTRFKFIDVQNDGVFLVSIYQISSKVGGIS